MKGFNGLFSSKEADNGSSLENEKYVVPKQKWYGWFPEGTSAAEKKLVLKTDFFLLTYSCMAFFLKYIDQTNISNAWVSGMPEDLGFAGTDILSWLNTWYSIGVILGSIPMTLLTGYFRPRFYLPILDLLWSLCVLLTFKCTNSDQICAIRFLVGLFESAANPGTHYILGCIYRKHELMRRSGFFVISGVIGQATSGYIQAGLYLDMNGKQGLAAWQWLFIFDFLIGIPVVIWGLIAIPELPHTNHKTWWMTEEESQMLKSNLAADGKVNKKITFDKTQIMVILKSWQFYCFPIGYSLWQLTCNSYMIQFFGLYLKHVGGYSVPQINNIPTAISGVNLFTMILTGILADKLGRRWPVCLIVGSILTVAAAMLASDNRTRELRMVAYTMTGVYGCFTPILSGWCNISCATNPYLRAVTIPWMIVLGSVVSTPVQQNVFPSSQTPYYTQTHGYAFTLGFTITLTLFTGVCIPLVESYFSRRNVPLVSDGESGNIIEAEASACEEESHYSGKDGKTKVTVTQEEIEKSSK